MREGPDASAWHVRAVSAALLRSIGGGAAFWPSGSKELVTADQVEALGAGRIDAGILRSPIDQRGLETIPISREPFVVAVPAGHPLAKGWTLTLKDLDRQPLVM